MSAPRGNLVAVSLGRLVVAISGFAVNVVVARALSRDDFGTWRWVWSVAAVAAFVADLGLWQRVTHQVAVDPSVAPRITSVALRATALLAIPTLLLVGGYVAATDGRPEVIAAALLAGGTTIALAAAHHVQAAFYGLRRMFLEFPSLVASRVAYVVGSLAVVALGGSVVVLYGARLVSALLLLGWAIATFHRAVGPLERRLPAGELRRFLAHGRDFGAGVLFGAIVAQADVLLLQLFVPEAEVARYAAPSALMIQLGMLPAILYSGLFPRIARLGRGHPELRVELAFQTRILLVTGLPVTVGGVVLAGPLVTWMFGDAYLDAAWPMGVLLATLPFRFLANGYAVTLTAVDQQSLRARIGAVGAAFNLIVNLVAIPLGGALGAAITTLLTDVALAWAARLALADELDGRAERDALLRTALPALAMGLVVALVPGLHLLLRVLLGAAVFVPLVVATGGLRRADLAHLRSV